MFLDCVDLILIIENMTLFRLLSGEFSKTYLGILVFHCFSATLQSVCLHIGVRAKMTELFISVFTVSYYSGINMYVTLQYVYTSGRQVTCSLSLVGV